MDSFLVSRLGYLFIIGEIYDSSILLYFSGLEFPGKLYIYPYFRTVMFVADAATIKVSLMLFGSLRKMIFS